LVLEAQADKIYYSSLWQKLKGIPDSDEVKELLGTEIDLRNLLYIFSFKQMKMDPELLKEMMVAVHYKLPKSIIHQLISTSYETIPRFVTWPPYVDLAKNAVDLLDKGLLSETENLFSQHLYSSAETTALRNPNSLVYVFAYLDLCVKEARNLTTLAVGKQLKLEEEKVRSSLLL
jgi:vacuolar-type H+-ATPase subunit C/Vma6